MLRDITTTSAQLNSSVVPCFRQTLDKVPTTKRSKRRVRFDAEGTSPTSAAVPRDTRPPRFERELIAAMESEKRQKKKGVMGGATTPQKKKTRRLEKPVIGSSSTWKEEQLDLYKVVAREAVVQDMIPAKWFEFSRLAEYQAGKIRLLRRLRLARETLVSVQHSDRSSNNLLLRKSAWFNFAFVSLRDLVTLKMTDSRKKNLAEKRRERRDGKEEDEDDNTFPIDRMPPPVSVSLAHRVGPEPSPEPEEEPSRISSISDPEVSSAGSKLYHSCREATTQNLGNQFCIGSLMTLFDSQPQLPWVKRSA